MSTEPNVDISENPIVDISGTPITDISGTPITDISGTPITDISGTPIVDISGTPIVDISGTPIVDISGNPITDISGTPIVDISGTIITAPPAPAPAPAPITMNDILSSVEVIEQKETTDKNILESIGNITFDTLKAKLIQWAKLGFPSAYEIHQVSVTPPPVCSDGVTRDLADYISFCSGKSIAEHVAVLQAKISDMTVSFANMGTYIAIVISKPSA